MEYKIASKKKRIFAYLIDAFIQTILFLPLTFLLVKVFNNEYSWRDMNYIVCFITYVCNRIIYAYFHNGSSLGKIIVGIKVINKNNKKLTLTTIILKEIIFYILKYLDLLWILFGKDNQTAHDILLDLIVIEDY